VMRVGGKIEGRHRWLGRVCIRIRWVGVGWLSCFGFLFLPRSCLGLFSISSSSSSSSSTSSSSTSLTSVSSESVFACWSVLSSSSSCSSSSSSSLSSSSLSPISSSYASSTTLSPFLWLNDKVIIILEQIVHVLLFEERRVNIIVRTSEGIHKVQEVKRKSMLWSIPPLHMKKFVDVFSCGIFLVINVVRIFSAFLVRVFDKDNLGGIGPIFGGRPNGIEE